MAKNNEDLYQALFNKQCPNRKEAKKWMKNDKIHDPYTQLYHSLLANYGGEPFSEKETSKIFQNLNGVLFKPGSTPKSLLEKLVGWGLLHKLD